MSSNEELLIKLVEQQGEIKQTLVAIESNVREHMRRTANLEGRVEVLASKDNDLDLRLTQHMAQVKGAGILLASVATSVALVAGTLKIIGVL